MRELPQVRHLENVDGVSRSSVDAHGMPGQRESERRFQTIVEHAPIGIVTIGAGGEIISANRAFHRMLGYSEEEMRSIPFSSLVPPSDVDQAGERWKRFQSLVNGEIDEVTAEARYIRKDGSIIWARISLSAVRDDDGRFLHTVSMIEDISEQKTLEQRQLLLLEASAALASSLDFETTLRQVARLSVPALADLCAVSLVDADGTIRRVAVAHADPQKQPLADALMDAPPLSGDETAGVSEALRTGRTQLYPDCAADLLDQPSSSPGLAILRDLSVSSLLIVPLIVKGATIGTLSFAYAGRARVYRDGDIGIAEDLARRAATAIDNARLHQQTRESQARFRSAFHDAAVGMAIIALDGRLIQVNPALCAMTTYSEAELLSMTDADVSHPEDAGIGHGLTEQLVQGAIDTFQIEKRYLNKDGSTIWCLVNIAAVRDERGTPLYLLAQVQDISERRALEAQLSHQALHDSLTGLPNRTLLLDRLDREVSLSRRHGGWVAVLFLDLDHFKVINDSLGHSAGDTLLVMVAQRLLRSVRENDTVARFGGDEFVIVIGEIGGAEGAVEVANRIIEAMEKPFNIAGRAITVTPSIGIAVGEAGQHHRNDLLRQADIAMYRAKARGRAGYDMFDAAMHDSALQRLELEHDLRRALENDELFLMYQPTISISTGAVVGMEALARWQHPERGLISPAEFIPMAEETGLIVQIGEWVLREACRQAAEWNATRGGGSLLQVSVNLSARQFRQRELIRLVESALIDADLPPEQLILELTESVIMEHASEAVERLRELTALGVRIAIDDFGTGYSSLAYLQQFPVSILKIDRSFVHRIGEEQDGMPIVSATIGLAHTLGLTIVAEGIETVEQRRVLGNLGCDQGQGYYFARPLPAGEMGVWLGGVGGGEGTGSRE